MTHISEITLLIAVIALASGRRIVRPALLARASETVGIH